MKRLERILSALQDPTIPASSPRTKYFYALHFSSEAVNIAVNLFAHFIDPGQVVLVRLSVG
jgi:hypothetical protein